MPKLIENKINVHTEKLVCNNEIWTLWLFCPIFSILSNIRVQHYMLLKTSGVELMFSWATYNLTFVPLTCSAFSDVNGNRVFLLATNIQWIIKAVSCNIVYYFWMLHSYYKTLEQMQPYFPCGASIFGIQWTFQTNRRKWQWIVQFRLILCQHWRNFIWSLLVSFTNYTSI